MLKYCMVVSDSTVRTSCTPRRARFGASLPLGAAIAVNSGGTEPAVAISASTSPLRKASQCGWLSSMIETSTSSTIGSRRPLKRSQHGPAGGVVGRRLGVVEHLAEARVALEHDLRAAAPALQAEGPGADRVVADLVAVELDHLARLRAGRAARRQPGGDEARARLGEAELQRVAIQRREARRPARRSRRASWRRAPPFALRPGR